MGDERSPEHVGERQLPATTAPDHPMIGRVHGEPAARVHRRAERAVEQHAGKDRIELGASPRGHGSDEIRGAKRSSEYRLGGESRACDRVPLCLDRVAVADEGEDDARSKRDAERSEDREAKDEPGRPLCRALASSAATDAQRRSSSGSVP